MDKLSDDELRLIVEHMSKSVSICSRLLNHDFKQVVEERYRPWNIYLLSETLETFQKCSCPFKLFDTVQYNDKTYIVINMDETMIRLDNRCLSCMFHYITLNWKDLLKYNRRYFYECLSFGLFVSLPVFDGGVLKIKIKGSGPGYHTVNEIKDLFEFKRRSLSHDKMNCICELGIIHYIHSSTGRFNKEYAKEFCENSIHLYNEILKIKGKKNGL